MIKKLDFSISREDFYSTTVKLGGQATKIIIPSDMQNMASLVTTASELLKK